VQVLESSIGPSRGGGPSAGRRRAGVLALVALAAASPPARADRPSETPPPPSCLDQSISDELGARLRPRGVQKRHFLKRGQIELVARGGLFAGDLLSSSYAVGGALAFFLTEDLGFEVGLDLTPLALDLDAPVAAFLGDDRFDDGTAYLGTAGLLWSPIHAKLKIGDRIVHADVLLAAGAGRIFHDSAQGASFDGGLVLELLTHPWLTIRLELRDVVAVLEAAGESRLTNNILATGGVALWLPTPL
jgi:outer membrane beta-barrel protein